ncbi:hypothetical protein C7271_02360 [filamentous cyanobacterium CCP5]|nr:hypothetical protein C7271_02360 [filamentous cyanobacterium CCP5]
MTTHDPLQHAVGVFPSKEHAQQAIESLKSNGFPLQQVSVVARKSEDNQYLSGIEIQETVGNQSGPAAKDGAVVGGVGGAVLGATEALGVTTALALLPGAGQVLVFGSVAANALATAVAGGAIGAAGGGLIGGLLGWGVPEKHAKIYQDRVIDGQYLVLLEGTETQVNQAANWLNPKGIQEWNVYEIKHA